MIPPLAEYLMQSTRKKSTNILLFQCLSFMPSSNILWGVVGYDLGESKCPFTSKSLLPYLSFLPGSQNEIYFILVTSEQTCVYIFSQKLHCPYRFLNKLSDQVQKYVNCCLVGPGKSRTYHSNEGYPIL